MQEVIFFNASKGARLNSLSSYWVILIHPFLRCETEGSYYIHVTCMLWTNCSQYNTILKAKKEISRCTCFHIYIINLYAPLKRTVQKKCVIWSTNNEDYIHIYWSILLIKTCLYSKDLLIRCYRLMINLLKKILDDVY